MNSLEEAVIGAMLMDNKQWSRVRGILRPEMIYDGLNRHIFSTIGREVGSGRAVDTLILLDLCTNDNFSKDAVFERLKSCMASCETSAYAGRYATQARKIWAAWKFNQLAKDLPAATPQNIDELSESLKNTAETLMPVVEISDKGSSLAEIARRYKGDYFCDKAKPLYITGFQILDECMKLEPGDVTIIAARPSVGKSAYSTQMAKNMSDNGVKVGFFSLEMSHKQCYERFVASLSGIGLRRLTRAVAFTNDEEEKFAKANKILEEDENLTLYEQSFTVEEIRKEVEAHKFDVVFIDYLQLVTPSNRYGGNRVQEVGEISHGLKKMAMDLKCHVIALSQFNRSAANQDAGEPTADQLRESGDLEQDASNIILLWNNSKDNNDLKTLKLDKCRQGERFVKISLRFNGDSMRFEEVERIGYKGKSTRNKSTTSTPKTDDDGYMKVEDSPFDNAQGTLIWR